ncbi:MAG: alpha/beta hydrolase [Acidimicrobiales bacterium]
MSPRRRASLMAGLVLVLAACSGGGSTDVPSTETTLPAAEWKIDWKPCVDSYADGSECGTMEVPYDYSDPSIGMFTLHMRRHPAGDPTKRIGTLLVNPGGPGFGGQFLAESASSIFGAEVVERFDILGWDPRGTGESTPAVDCFDEYDDYVSYDPSPETDEQKQVIIDLSKNFADACGGSSGPILPYISTNNSARDMDAIRQALGEKKITYFGFSYGSELGGTWASMFPSTVRAAVLDGAADPTADSITGSLQQAEGFEKELNAFLDQCSKDTTCPFWNKGRTAAAFDELAKKVDEKPVLVSAKRTRVNQSVFLTAVAQAMYTSAQWPELEQALADIQQGNGQGILDLYDEYYQRNPDGSYGNELEAFTAISCLDDPGPKTIEETDSYLARFVKVAPRFGEYFVSGYTCIYWPAKPDPRNAITGEGAGPIVVVGTTGDSATPLASSRKMAETLEDGRLIVVDAQRHTGYGANDCVTGAVDQFLVTTKVTFSEKSC